MCVQSLGKVFKTKKSWESFARIAGEISSDTSERRFLTETLLRGILC